MKLKALLLACAVAGAGASFALADDGHGEHHHGTTTGTTATTTTAATTTTMTTTTTPSGCTRMELRGTLASVSATSFTLTVKRAGGDDDEDNNAAEAALVGQTVTIAVDASTRVEWRGTGTLIGPNVGDSAKVKANSCGTPATLTALRVKADGPRAAHGESHNSSKSHK